MAMTSQNGRRLEPREKEALLCLLHASVYSNMLPVKEFRSRLNILALLGYGCAPLCNSCYACALFVPKSLTSACSARLGANPLSSQQCMSTFLPWSATDAWLQDEAYANIQALDIWP